MGKNEKEKNGQQEKGHVSPLVVTPKASRPLAIAPKTEDKPAQAEVQNAEPETEKPKKQWKQWKPTVIVTTGRVELSPGIAMEVPVKLYEAIHNGETKRSTDRDEVVAWRKSKIQATRGVKHEYTPAHKKYIASLRSAEKGIAHAATIAKQLEDKDAMDLCGLAAETCMEAIKHVNGMYEKAVPETKTEKVA